MTDPAPNLIGGAWLRSESDARLEVRDPASGALIGWVPAGCAADAAAAVAAARAAAPGWARTPAASRGALLRAWAARLRDAADQIADLQVADSGTPRTVARAGVAAGIAAVEQYAELGPVHRGRALPGGWDAGDWMTYGPRGVVAVLAPGSDPVAVICRFLAAALASGNTVVLSPSERAARCGARPVDVLAGLLPPGVVNLVHGDARVGGPLAADPGIDVVVHVGSAATAASVGAACAASGAHAVLEVAGTDACVVDRDVDPRWAAGQVALGAFTDAGQLRDAVERVYVHRDIAPQLLSALVDEARAQITGDPRDPATTMGPLLDRRRRDLVHQQVAAARAQGARLLCGGVVPPGQGAFYPPTVLIDVTDGMAVMRDPTCGPVAPVLVVDSFEEGLRRAARSRHSLAASVLTGSMRHAERAARELPVGALKINGVCRSAPAAASPPGEGSRRGFGAGAELLDELSRFTYVHWAAPPP